MNCLLAVSQSFVLVYVCFHERAIFVLIFVCIPIHVFYYLVIVLLAAIDQQLAA